MDIVADDSEFGILIKQVVHKKIPAFIDGTRVFLTNGITLKKGGVILKEITVEPPGRNDPCPYCFDVGKTVSVFINYRE